MDVVCFSFLKIPLLGDQSPFDFMVTLLRSKRKKVLSFVILDEKDWGKWFFSARKRRFIGLLDFFLFSSPSLSSCLKKKFNRKMEMIDINRLLYDVLVYCHKNHKRVTFIGFDEKDQNQIKKNLSLFKDEKSSVNEQEVLSFSFLSSFVLRYYDKDDVRTFIQKMSPDFVMCKDESYFSIAEEVFKRLFEDSTFLLCLVNRKVEKYLVSRRTEKSFFCYSWKKLLLQFFLLPFFIVKLMLKRLWWFLKLPLFFIFYVMLRRCYLREKAFAFSSK